MHYRSTFFLGSIFSDHSVLSLLGERKQIRCAAHTMRGFELGPAWRKCHHVRLYSFLTAISF